MREIEEERLKDVSDPRGLELDRWWHHWVRGEAGGETHQRHTMSSFGGQTWVYSNCRLSRQKQHIGKSEPGISNLVGSIYSRSQKLQMWKISSRNIEHCEGKRRVPAKTLRDQHIRCGWAEEGDPWRWTGIRRRQEEVCNGRQRSRELPEGEESKDKEKE